MTPQLLPITKVSQTRNFFHRDIEKLFSTIEGAADPVLNKLIQGQPIDPIERRVMAVYLEMYKVRNREQRERLKGEFFGDRDKVAAFMDAGMEHMRGTRMHVAYTKHKMNLVEYFETESEQVFSDAWVPSNFIRWLFFCMTWRVVESDVVDFVVGEPPLAFAGTGTKGTGIGLEHLSAEVFFPLSSRHVLHLSWFGDPSMARKEVFPPTVARQANKIFINKSARFVFFNKDCPKMSKLIKKKRFHNNEVKLNWAESGVNPYWSKQLSQLTDEERNKFSVNICMHPEALNFSHAWREAGSLFVVDNGGKVTRWCERCGVMELKYEDNVEPEIRNSEVALATGKWGTHQNWWVEWSKRNHQI